MCFARLTRFGTLNMLHLFTQAIKITAVAVLALSWKLKVWGWEGGVEGTRKRPACQVNVSLNRASKFWKQMFCKFLSSLLSSPLHCSSLFFTLFWPELFSSVLCSSLLCWADGEVRGLGVLLGAICVARARLLPVTFHSICTALKSKRRLFLFSL